MNKWETLISTSENSFLFEDYAKREQRIGNKMTKLQQGDSISKKK